MNDLTDETTKETLRRRYGGQPIADNLNKSITEGYKDLISTPPENCARLSERAFIEVYIPLIKGNDPEWFQKWLAVAGSPNMPVVLVDENDTQTNIVPPLTGGLNLESTKGVDLQEAGLFLNMTRENGRPWQGSEAMTDAIIALDSKSNEMPVLDQWVALIRSYESPEEKVKHTSDKDYDLFDF